jgi:hypothetical protein
MHPLPPELQPRRDQILARVRRRGRQLHRRRVASIVAPVVVLATLAVTVGLAAEPDHGNELRVAGPDPSTTQATTTTDAAPGTSVVPTTAPTATTAVT